jgi:DNA recombination protein RmuC
MNDVFLLTTIFVTIAAVAVFVSLHFYRKQADTSFTNEESFKHELELAVSKLDSLRFENINLRETLAASKANVNHLEGFAVEYDLQKKQLLTQQEKLSELKADISKLDTQVAEKSEQVLFLRSEHATLLEKHDLGQTAMTQLRQTNAQQQEKLNQMGELRNELTAAKQLLISKDELLSELKTQLATDQEAQKFLQEKIELLESSEQRLTTQFENTANKIFKEKTGEFSDQNKTSLDALLTPLKEQIGSFSKQVTDVYTAEAKERHALKQEVTSLKALNEHMSKEANALTKALKGDNKKQGTWGEVVLERVLQESGLRKGHEYDTQMHLKDSEGAAFKPDVVVHLPGDKDVVIDSKMALTAYERFYNADDDISRQQALKEHIIAIKTHINALSSKNYQDLLGIKTLDYVLMFIPVEPAFNAAMEQDSGLVQLALEKNIMLVSPTNLMVALKTINNMWRVEYQNQNAQDIAKNAGAIYDKLVGFVEDMNKLGTHLQRADKSYGDAMKKLSTGSGNLIRRAEQMKALRIGNNKALPADIVELSDNFELAANS